MYGLGKRQYMQSCLESDECPTFSDLPYVQYDPVLGNA